MKEEYVLTRKGKSKTMMIMIEADRKDRAGASR